MNKPKIIYMNEETNHRKERKPMTIHIKIMTTFRTVVYCALAVSLTINYLYMTGKMTGAPLKQEAEDYLTQIEQQMPTAQPQTTKKKGK